MVPHAVEKFYAGFITGNVPTMQSFYHAEAAFTNYVFGTLNARRVKAMRAMLLSKAPSLQVTFEILESQQEKQRVNRTAVDVFSATNRSV